MMAKKATMVWAPSSLTRVAGDYTTWGEEKYEEESWR
jgi:hypothetical protein